MDQLMNGTFFPTERSAPLRAPAAEQFEAGTRYNAPEYRSLDEVNEQRLAESEHFSSPTMKWKDGVSSRWRVAAARTASKRP
jgi:hypothetical protein